jgi:hypothetical protein
MAEIASPHSNHKEQQANKTEESEGEHQKQQQRLSRANAMPIKERNCYPKIAHQVQRIKPNAPVKQMAR